MILLTCDSPIMVPMVGLEPTRPCGQQILSLSRLPIPTHRHIINDISISVNFHRTTYHVLYYTIEKTKNQEFFYFFSSAAQRGKTKIAAA